MPRNDLSAAQSARLNAAIDDLSSIFAVLGDAKLGEKARTELLQGEDLTNRYRENREVLLNGILATNFPSVIEDHETISSLWSYMNIATRGSGGAPAFGSYLIEKLRQEVPIPNDVRSTRRRLALIGVKRKVKQDAASKITIDSIKAVLTIALFAVLGFAATFGIVRTLNHSKEVPRKEAPKIQAPVSKDPSGTAKVTIKKPQLKKSKATKRRHRPESSHAPVLGS
jgi:hypothetical protein